MRLLFASSVALSLLAGCGSDAASTGSTGGVTDGGPTAAEGTAQVRFRYKADWLSRLGSCAAISDYRIKFGANPVPVSASIEPTADSLSPYVGVDGRTYKDADVLHVYTCIVSQTSKETKQLFGRFGADLPFAPSKRYTVTLAGTGATVAEDP